MQVGAVGAVEQRANTEDQADAGLAESGTSGDARYLARGVPEAFDHDLLSTEQLVDNETTAPSAPPR